MDDDGYPGGPDGTDCDDGTASTYPGAFEVPYDGVDQDCDGADLIDVDGDGYAGGTGSDCDDDDASIHPGASEIPYDGIDNDCDGGDLRDVDADGYAADVIGGMDCDDADEDIHPGADETAGDGVDSDCDGADPELGRYTFTVGDDTSFFWSAPAYRGNIYSMERDVMLEQFSVYLAGHTECFIDFYVHERDGPWDSWETIWASHHYFAYYMSDWYHSSYIDEWLEEGKEYALGAAWNCSFTYFRQTAGAVPSTTAYSFEGTTSESSYDGYEGDYMFPSETSGGPANYQLLELAW